LFSNTQIAAEAFQKADTQKSSLSAHRFTVIEVKGHSFLANIDKLGRVKLHFVAKVLGKGGEAIVFKVVDLTKGVEKAWKKPHNAEKAIGVNKERQLLRDFHDGKKTEIYGLQSAPSKKEEFMMPLDDHDYGESINTDQKSIAKADEKKEVLQKRLPEFHQIMSGISFLHKRGIPHKDIKYENIRQKTDNNGNKLTQLTDVGGGESFTPMYTPKHEQEKAKELRAKDDENGAKEIEKKMDVFAMGCLMCEALTGGETAYQIDDDTDYPLLDSQDGLRHVVDNLDDKQQLQSLILRMTDPDPNQRPSIDEALGALEDYMKSDMKEAFNATKALQSAVIKSNLEYDQARAQKKKTQ
jgi:serine/threonine protein kinase